MTLSLNADPCKITQWTALQTEICMNVANAKFFAFVDEAERVADFVRLGILDRHRAVECLHEAAIYNSLIFEYGADRIQAIMSEAFKVAA
jgi:hypothetical protein